MGSPFFRILFSRDGAQGILSVLVGGVFIFSGFLKLNDPMGLAIKLEEYFYVFAADGLSFFRFFVPVALPMAFVLIVVEILLGLSIIVSYRIRLIKWLTMLMLVLFTSLTFYSAYFDRVTDCGCFGDAIHLTPWESFTKNVVLVVLAIVLFSIYRSLRTGYAGKEGEENVARSILPVGRGGDFSMLGLAAICFFMCLYAVKNLPYIDFRSYAVGTHIPTLVTPAEEPSYAYLFEKDGEVKQFDTYLEDTTYHFVDVVLLNGELSASGAENYELWDASQDNVTSLSFTGTRLFVVLRDMDEVSTGQAQRLAQQLASIDTTDMTPWVLTSSAQETQTHFLSQHPALKEIPCYGADRTLLLTMLRSNVGAVLLRDGWVLGKWTSSNWPTARRIQRLLSQKHGD